MGRSKYIMERSKNGPNKYHGFHWVPSKSLIRSPTSKAPPPAPQHQVPGLPAMYSHHGRYPKNRHKCRCHSTNPLVKHQHENPRSTHSFRSGFFFGGWKSQGYIKKNMETKIFTIYFFKVLEFEISTIGRAY